MSDDLDAQLAALEEAAPLTPDPEEEGAAPVAPEGAAPAAPPATADPTVQPQVPLGALKEERARRRELERRAEEQERSFKEFQQRIAAELQVLRRPTQPQEPLTHEEAVQALWEERVQREQREFQQQQQTAQQHQQQEQQQRYVETIRAKMGDLEENFREIAPDYDDASSHLLQHQSEIFGALGYDEAEANQLLDQWSLHIVATALQKGKNPAQAIYEAAKKAGYAGRQPVAQPSQAAQPPAQAALAMRAAGAAEAQTLTGGGAAPGGDGLTLKSIVSLKGAAFDAAVEKFLRDAR